MRLYFIKSRENRSNFANYVKYGNILKITIRVKLVENSKNVLVCLKARIPIITNKNKFKCLTI